MLVPTEFARLAVVHGTVASVSDPHEIANVCGLEGVDFMIENAKKSPFYFNFGAPSCVPATAFETSGALLGPAEVRKLLERPEIRYLTEMMNYPGVLMGNPEVLKKLAHAKELGKPIDGHAPGLRGSQAKAYADAGISTDHECATIEEAIDKLECGMYILIREGSAAKNFDELIDLIDTWPHRLMFCSDDKHPDDLVKGHLDALLRRGAAKGKDMMALLRACTLHPVRHYGLDNGLLQPGDPADLVVMSDPKNWQAKDTYIAGVHVASNGKCLIPRLPDPIKPINRFNCQAINPAQLAVAYPAGTIPAIGILEGQIITNKVDFEHSGGLFHAQTSNDLLKIAVINRYHPTPPAVAVVHGSGLRQGAIASTVAHDSHNIIAMGCNDIDLCAAINALVQAQGGIAAACGNEQFVMPLPVAGLMSMDPGHEVAYQYEKIDQWVKEILGCGLAAPYMTLSFLALLVIPKLKLSDKGLFDGEKFAFVNIGH
jgi:adenine deaminase